MIYCVKTLERNKHAQQNETRSKRELIQPHTGDECYVRRKADGTFGKTVEVGRSLSADMWTERSPECSKRARYKSGLVDIETGYLLIFASAGFDVHSGGGPERGSWGVGEVSKAIPLTA